MVAGYSSDFFSSEKLNMGLAMVIVVLPFLLIGGWWPFRATTWCLSFGGVAPGGLSGTRLK
jgi:hypothetical protein